MSRSLFGNFLPLILSFLNICVKSSISRGDLDFNSTFTCNGRGWTPSMTPRYNSLPEKKKFRHDNTIRQCSHLTPRAILEFSDDIFGIIATNDIGCFWCWSSGVVRNRTENDHFNLSYFKYVRGLIKNKTYSDAKG